LHLTLLGKKEIIEKMKRIGNLSIIGVLIASLAVSPPALAQEMILQPAGETPLDGLQANCDTIQATLRRLHTNDALLRVNIGQVYNGISVRLMARLNSRLALARIDSSKMVEITNRFEVERVTFSDKYKTYEASLSGVTKIDCKQNPAGFYAALITARDARRELADAVQAMNASVSEYQTAVEHLQQERFGSGSSAEQGGDDAN